MAHTKKQVAAKVDEGGILDSATSRLLRAVKEKAHALGKPLKKSELLQQGYSERFVDKVDQA